jgi:hypothetical protein
MSRRLILTFAAVAIVGVAGGVAFTYPSHAYQTAATSEDLAAASTVHTYCMTVGAFEPVSTPWQINRRWPVRLGIFGAGLALALVSLIARSRGSNISPVRPPDG